ncbi:hypothetical protein EDB64_3264 [Vibrio crassostreae]|nr:hypothetical protein EDB64_3264 [Vibrio crassostreae]
MRGFLLLVIYCEMRDARCEMRDARCEMRDARCEMRDARNRRLMWPLKSRHRGCPVFNQHGTDEAERLTL